MDERQNPLGLEPVGKLLLKYSIPAITGMLVTALYNIVDRIFIGKIPEIGATAIAGVGVTMPIMTVILAFSMLIGVGATASISLHLGRNQPKEAQEILGNALTLILFFSAVLTVLGLCFVNPILSLFGAGENTIYYAREYIVVILIGTVFNMTGFAMNHTIRADGSPIIAGLTMVIGCFLNAILDPIFIFVFGWGVRGAAIATILSQFVSMAWVLYYYIGGKSRLKINLHTLKPRLKTILTILAIGVSPFSMQIATSVVQAVLNNQLKALGGEVAIGAFTIIMSVSMLFMMVIFGLNQGAQPTIGFNYGAKKFERVRKAFFAIVIVGTGYLTLGFLLTQLFPAFITKLFNEDPALTQITTEGMRINLFTLPLLAVCVIGSVFFQNIGKAKISMTLSILRQFLLLIPALIILPRFWGLKGVWLAQPLCDALSFIIISICVYFELRKQRRQEMEIKNGKCEE